MRKSEARCRFCFYHSMMPWPQAANQTPPVWGGSLPGWQRKLLPFAADLHVHTMLRAISYGLRGRQVRQRHLVLFLRPAMLSCALTAGRGTARRRWYLGTANSKPASYHCRSLQGATFIRADGLGDYRGAVDLDMSRSRHVLCHVTVLARCWDHEMADGEALHAATSSDRRPYANYGYTGSSELPEVATNLSA